MGLARELRFQLRHALRLVFHTPRLILDQADYDAYWESKRKGRMGEISLFQRRRADIALESIRDGESVLDVGCGDGAVLLYLMKQRRLTACAADISDKALAFLASQGVSTRKFDMNAPEAVADLPEVDHVILFEVLEHMQNPEAFLRSMEAKARKSVLFSIPNTGYFAYRLRLLMGRAPMQWRTHPGEHLRYWTRKDLVWWLDSLGYGKRSTIRIYEGLPILNRIRGSLFGMGFVVRIDKA